MRPFMMTLIALTTFAATVVTAQAESETARPSQISRLGILNGFASSTGFSRHQMASVGQWPWLNNATDVSWAVSGFPQDDPERLANPRF
jgi:hypothetical protein